MTQAMLLVPCQDIEKFRKDTEQKENGDEDRCRKKDLWRLYVVIQQSGSWLPFMEVG